MADFALIKERVTILEVGQMLGLQLRKTGAQFRGMCPACNSGGDRALVITPDRGLFYCFNAGVGGDLISLCGHVQKCTLADAGRHIADHFQIGNMSTGAPVHGTPVPTAPQKPEAGDNRSAGLQPLDYLQADHEAVIAAGFNPEEAQALGIGFANKGLMRGTVAVPIRDETGTLLGYIGVQEARCPPKGLLGNNIVKFPKSA